MTADINQVLERATARPWERREHYAGIPIHGPNNEYVAAVVQCPPCGGKVNAELIVTAVNSFESQRELIRELAEALTELYSDTADYIARNNLGDIHHNQSMKMANAALAKVREVAL